MAAVIEFETQRLILRQWRESDKVPFADINADAEIMRFYPNVLTRTESDAMADRCRRLIDERGWGFWVAELKSASEFIGFVGLHIPSAELPFSPCVEIGWRLARRHWGSGYATEAACAALRIGFERLGLDEIVAFTALDNLRSRTLMQRLGMTHRNELFDHPQIPPGNPLRRHCLYRLSKTDWQVASAGRCADSS